MNNPSQKVSKAQSPWKKLVLILGIAIIFYAGMRYLSISKSVTSPTQKVSLNPNTGSLYGDINTRLKEVLK